MKDNLDEIRQEFDAIDREMAALFCRRLQLGAKAAAWKHEHGLPVLDTSRQFEVLRRNGKYVTDPSLKDFYADFQHEVMGLTRRYEQELIERTDSQGDSQKNSQGDKKATLLTVKTGSDSYDIIIERGALNHIGDYLDLNRKVLIVSDDGVPEDYIDSILAQCPEGYRYIFRAGEQSKNTLVLTGIFSQMTEHCFTRSDAVLAIGGGVTSDIAGFAAATYMRGIDFYNVPTTLLAQVDASVGGKTAIDFNGVKNVVGAFHQPRKVIIDTDTLKTLDRRLFNEGLAEALKMAATFSRPLFDRIADSQHIEDEIDYVIAEALKLKKRVVEEDPHEQELRRVLNFGHTVGHAVEAACHGQFFHGECVGMGMLYFCSGPVREEIRSVLEKYALPVLTDIDADTLMSFIRHDKKKTGDDVNVVYVNEIGTFELKRMNMRQLNELIQQQHI